MPVRRPSYYPGGFYHFYNRGAHREPIFRETEIYLYVTKKIKFYSQELQLTLIAYCLMPNHYHFLIRQDGRFSAGLLPQRVFNSYSKAYNRCYQHSGTLFEGNYRVKEIKNEIYLRQLCRYIHGNPVKDGFVKNPEDWIYSNYLEFVGKRKGSLYDPKFVKDNFGNASGYQNYVLDGVTLKNMIPEINEELPSKEKRT